jgi:hypothetical protein
MAKMNISDLVIDGFVWGLFGSIVAIFVIYVGVACMHAYVGRQDATAAEANIELQTL